MRRFTLASSSRAHSPSGLPSRRSAIVASKGAARAGSPIRSRKTSVSARTMTISQLPGNSVSMIARCNQTARLSQDRSPCLSATSRSRGTAPGRRGFQRSLPGRRRWRRRSGPGQPMFRRESNREASSCYYLRVQRREPVRALSLKKAVSPSRFPAHRATHPGMDGPETRRGATRGDRQNHLRSPSPSTVGSALRH